MIPKFMNDPFLLVLDLNGTLLYRKKSKSGKCGSVVARPYLQSFLRYCLGACYDMDAKAFAKAWPFKDREPVYFNVPGSDMWDTCKLSSYALPLPVGTKFYPPRTPIFVTIWSSATYSNVIQMIELITHSDVQRTLFQRVWSRDTLVTTFDSHRKVSTTKDLTIVWDELNRWSMYLENRISAKEKLCFRSRALADMRYCAWLDMMRHRASSIEKKISNMRSEQCLFYEAMERSNGRMLDLMYGPLMHTPFGPKNTILLDDSIGKARCQPNNHVCIPEYVKDEAAVYSKYLAIGEPEEMVMELDDFLLQFIGVLDTARDVPNVVEWIEHGGIASFSKNQTLDQRFLWAERGRNALEREGIPVRP